MADLGHQLTDKELEQLEKRIAREYAIAAKDMRRKLRDYMEQFEEGKAKQKALLDAGKITLKEYKDWVYRHTMMGNQWRDMKNVLAEDMRNASDIALRMSRDRMADIYALNANYAMYQIEHDFAIDTGFTLYNHDTAEYLLSEQRQLMPGPSARKAKEIAENKAMQWNRQKIQSAVLQGVLQGESPYEVAKRLMGVAQMGYNASVRYARTMTTSAQNAGRYNSYRRAKGLGVDLTIEWQATLDGRTRHEHRMMHGQRRDVDEPFEVDGVKILYPAQSDGPGSSDIPQSLIWNCRCTLLAWVKGFEGDTVKSSPKMGEMSFEEWQHAKEPKKPKAVAQSEPPKATELSFADKVAQIKQRIADNGGVVTEADLQEAGKLLADEYGTRAAENQRLYDEYVAPLDREYKLAAERYSAAYDDYWDNIRPAYRRGEISKEERDAADAHLQKLREERASAFSAFNDAKKKYVPTPKDNADWLKGKLGETREMGSSGSNIKRHLNNSKSKVVPYIEYAYDHYPKDWVERSVADSYLMPRQVSRGHYSHWAKELYISGSGNDAIETAIHELGHRFEYVIPGIKDAEKAFYARRTDGCPLERLCDIFPGYGYKEYEKTRKDQFKHAYMGKDYGGDAFELVSMGFEEAFMNPYALSGDPDMQAWIYGILLLI